MKKYIKYLIVIISCIFSVSVINVSADELKEPELQYQVFVPLYAAPQNRMYNNLYSDISSEDLYGIITDLIEEKTFEQLGIEIPVDILEAIYDTLEYADGDKSTLPDVVADIIIVIDDLYGQGDVPEILVKYVTDTVFEYMGYYDTFGMGLALKQSEMLFNSIVDIIVNNSILILFIAFSLFVSAFYTFRSAKHI